MAKCPPGSVTRSFSPASPAYSSMVASGETTSSRSFAMTRTATLASPARWLPWPLRGAAQRACSRRREHRRPEAPVSRHRGHAQHRPQRVAVVPQPPRVDRVALGELIDDGPHLSRELRRHGGGLLGVAHGGEGVRYRPLPVAGRIQPQAGPAMRRRPRPCRPGHDRVFLAAHPGVLDQHQRERSLLPIRQPQQTGSLVQPEANLPQAPVFAFTALEVRHRREPTRSPGPVRPSAPTAGCA